MKKALRFAIVGTLLLGALATGCTKKRRSRLVEEEPTPAATNGIPGVSEDRIRIGMSAAFTGTFGGWGTEYYRGSLAYFAEVNSKGGVNGRSIEIAPHDDGYDLPRAMESYKQIIAENDVFMLYGAVGTKIIAELIPILAEHEKDDWMEFGNFTGAQTHRDMPGGKHVFNVKASYRQEMRALVEELSAAGYKKVGVFYQDDAYGKSGLDAAQRAIIGTNVTIVGTATHPVNQKYDVPVVDQVKKLRDAGADAVLCVVGYQAGAAFARDAREAGWNAPIGNLSPVSDSFLRLLTAYEAKTKKVVTNNLLHSMTVPAIDSDLPAVVEYRMLMDKRSLPIPAELQDPNYRALSPKAGSFGANQYGFTSLEGFICAKTFVEVLQRTGADLTRERFTETAEKLTEYDPGVQATLTWTPNSHEGLNKVWLLGVKNGSFVAHDPKDLAPQKALTKTATATPTPATAGAAAAADPGNRKR